MPTRTWKHGSPDSLRSNEIPFAIIGNFLRAFPFFGVRVDRRFGLPSTVPLLRPALLVGFFCPIHFPEFHFHSAASYWFGINWIVVSFLRSVLFFYHLIPSVASPLGREQPLGRFDLNDVAPLKSSTTKTASVLRIQFLDFLSVFMQKIYCDLLLSRYSSFDTLRFPISHFFPFILIFKSNDSIDGMESGLGDGENKRA